MMMHTCVMMDERLGQKGHCLFIQELRLKTFNVSICCRFVHVQDRVVTYQEACCHGMRALLPTVDGP